MKTTATRDGDEYVLNGQKVYVGSDNGCERLWVIAVTDPQGARHENLSWFMIDADRPGITVDPQYLLSALGESEMNLGHKNTIFFDGVRVPAHSLIGGENNGWRVAGTHLEFEHGAAGSIRPNTMWFRLLEHCRTTELDGRPLIEHQHVQDGLAEIYLRLESVRLLAVRNFWLSLNRWPMTYHGPQVSYLRKTTGLWLTGRILELLGPSALTSDPEWGALDGLAEGQQREGIVGMHPGGTTDIQRLIMARALGMERAPRPGRRPGCSAGPGPDGDAVGRATRTGRSELLTGLGETDWARRTGRDERGPGGSGTVGIRAAAPRSGADLHGPPGRSPSADRASGHGPWL